MIFTDITLFNRYVQAHDPAYQRTYLYKVIWDQPRFVLGQPASFSTLIQIPYEETLLYRPPIVWQADRSEHWTLQLEDVIVKGIVNVQIGAMTDLYDTYSLSDLRKKYELVVITNLYLNNTSISQQAFNVGAS